MSNALDFVVGKVPLPTPSKSEIGKRLLGAGWLTA
jgi:hypothetical protein